MDTTKLPSKEEIIKAITEGMNEDEKRKEIFNQEANKIAEEFLVSLPSLIKEEMSNGTYYVIMRVQSNSTQEEVLFREASSLVKEYVESTLGLPTKYCQFTGNLVIFL